MMLYFKAIVVSFVCMIGGILNSSWRYVQRSALSNVQPKVIRFGSRHIPMIPYSTMHRSHRASIEYEPKFRNALNNPSIFIQESLPTDQSAINRKSEFREMDKNINEALLFSVLFACGFTNPATIADALYTILKTCFAQVAVHGILKRIGIPLIHNLVAQLQKQYPSLNFKMGQAESGYLVDRLTIAIITLLIGYLYFFKINSKDADAIEHRLKIIVNLMNQCDAMLREIKESTELSQDDKDRVIERIQEKYKNMLEDWLSNLPFDVMHDVHMDMLQDMKRDELRQYDHEMESLYQSCKRDIAHEKRLRIQKLHEIRQQELGFEEELAKHHRALDLIKALTRDPNRYTDIRQRIERHKKQKITVEEQNHDVLDFWLKKIESGL